MSLNTYLLFLFIEVIDDDSNEEIEGEEGAKDDEEDKVDVHVDVDLPDGLLSNLPGGNCEFGCFLVDNSTMFL